MHAFPLVRKSVIIRFAFTGKKELFDPMYGHNFIGSTNMVFLVYCVHNWVKICMRHIYKHGVSLSLHVNLGEAYIPIDPQSEYVSCVYRYEFIAYGSHKELSGKPMEQQER